jgi:hypothetical protein
MLESIQHQISMSKAEQHQTAVANAGDRAHRAWHLDSTFTRETEIGGEERDSGDWWKD